MRRTSARLLCLILVLTLVFTTVAPALAATYRNGAQSGPSSSYKGGQILCQLPAGTHHR